MAWWDSDAKSRRQEKSFDEPLRDETFREFEPEGWYRSDPTIVDFLGGPAGAQAATERTIERQSAEIGRRIDVDTFRNLLDDEGVAGRNSFVREAGAGIMQGGLELASLAARPFDKESADGLIGLSDAAGQASDELIDERGAMSPTLSRAWRGATRSGTQMLAGGYARLGAYGLAGLNGLNTYNRALVEAENAGLEGEDRQRYALIQGGIEAGVTAAFQRAGFGGLEAQAAIHGGVSGGIKESLKRLGISTLEELPEELTIELTSAAVDAATGVSPEAMDPENLKETVVQTVLQTAMMGGVVGAPDVARGAVESIRGRRGSASRMENPGMNPGDSGQGIDGQGVGVSPDPVAEPSPAADPVAEVLAQVGDDPAALEALAAKPSRKGFGTALGLSEHDVAERFPRAVREEISRLAGERLAALPSADAGQVSGQGTEAAAPANANPVPASAESLDPQAAKAAEIKEAFGSLGGGSFSEDLRKQIFESIQATGRFPEIEQKTLASQVWDKLRSMGYPNDRQHALLFVNTLRNYPANDVASAAVLGNKFIDAASYVGGVSPEDQPTMPPLAAAIPHSVGPITADMVKGVFAGSTLEPIESGDGWRVRLPNGRHVDLRVTKEIAVKNWPKFELTRGKKYTPEERERIKLAGAFRLSVPGQDVTGLGLIRLHEGLANTAAPHTLRHEALHLARQAGLLADQEWAALVTEYSDPARPEKQQEEDVARAVGAWTGSEGLGKRIKEVIAAILRSFGFDKIDAADVQSLFGTEGFWSREPERSPAADNGGTDAGGRPVRPSVPEGTGGSADAAASDAQTAVRPGPAAEAGDGAGDGPGVDSGAGDALPAGQDDRVASGRAEGVRSEPSAEGGVADETRGDRTPQDGGRPRRDRDAGGEALEGASAETDGGPGKRGDAVRSPRERRNGDARNERSAVEERGPDGGSPPGGDEGTRPAPGRGVDEPPGHAPANYRITDADEIGKGGPKGKVRANIAAIRLLKEIEAAGRLATPEEQKVLAKYVGWGAFAQPIFSRVPSKGWETEAADVRELLTSEEFEAARRSTINAHYTSPAIIAGIWKGLESLGIRGGKVLEPAMGVGNFFGLMPEGIASRSSLAGVELDSLTGRIAQQLYQRANVKVMGFQDAKLPAGAFDLVISNVPFADVKINDPQDRELTRKRLSLHDYFFAKSLKLVRPGGIVAFITSRYTMDKTDSKVRTLLRDMGADFLGAVRLPRTAFQENAGTEVVTDLIVLQKRADGAAPGGEEWLSTDKITVGDSTFDVNRYWMVRSGNVLGEHSAAGSMYSKGEYTVDPKEGIDLGERIAEIVGTFKPAAMVEQAVARTEQVREKERRRLSADHLRDGNVVVQDGKAFEYRQGDLVEIEPDDLPYKGKRKTVLPKLDAAGKVRDAVRTLLRLQVSSEADEKAVTQARTAANEAYEKFVAEHGAMNLPDNRTVLARDVDAPLLRALEDWDEDRQTAKKAEILTTRTQFPVKRIERADSPTEALTASLSELGRVDLPFMSRLLGGKEESELIDELRGLIFRDPETKEWEIASLYLSGNVRKKLAQAKAAGEAFAGNVAALEQVIPEDVSPADIGVRLGSPWIPTEDYERFFKETFGIGSAVRRIAMTGAWTFKWFGSVSHAARDKYGTAERSPAEIAETLMNHGTLAVYKEVGSGADKRRVVDADATKMVEVAADEIRNAFTSWIWADDKRMVRLVRYYNDNFNNIVAPAFDGSHLTFPGMSEVWRNKLRQYQKTTIWRTITTGNGLFAHVVGAGKSIQSFASVMELRRLGIVKKPVFVVPNHLVAQMPAEFLTAYPSAKLLVAAPEDLSIGEKSGLPSAQRQVFMNRIATGDYDAIFVPHSSFEKIPLSAELQEGFFREQIDAIEAAADASRAEEGKKGRTVKELEKAKARLEEKMERLASEWKKDAGPFFDELGIDMLVVDEAHEFKNLFIHTKMGRLPGVGSGEGAQKSFDMYMKTSHLNRTGGKVLFMTGTPIANSVSEMFTMMRYLMPDALKERGIDAFDSWADTFGDSITQAEVKPDGSGFRMHTRFARFSNLPELMQLFRSIADVRMVDALPDLKAARPPLENGRPTVVTIDRTDALDGFVKELARRAEAVKERKVEPSEDNMLAITTDGRKAALDLRLVGLPEDPDGKLSACADRVAEIWKETKADRLTQLVWCDQGTPGTKVGINLYADLKEKLAARGVDPAEVAFIHDAKDDKQRANLFKKVREGRIRVLIANTPKLATGANIQTKLVATHHLDVPWKPAELEQRDGRILRPGNLAPQAKSSGGRVRIFRYVAKGSFDSYNWQTIETKAKFIAQAMADGTALRSIEDVDETALSAAEVKAIAADNPKMMEQVKLDAEVKRMSAERTNFDKQAFNSRRDVATLPDEIGRLEKSVAAAKKDAARLKPLPEGEFAVEIRGKLLTERKEAGQAIHDIIAQTETEQLQRGFPIGEFRGFPLYAYADAFGNPMLQLKGELDWSFERSDSPQGTIQKLVNVPSRMGGKADVNAKLLEQAREKLAFAKERAGRKWEREDEYQEKRKRLAVLTAELNQADKPAAQEVQEEADKELGGPGALGIVPASMRPAKGRADKLGAPDEVKAEDPDVEKRLAAAHGAERPRLRDRIGELTEAFRRSLRPQASIPESSRFATANETFRLLKGLPEAVKDETIRTVAAVLDPLGPKQRALFERFLIAENMLAALDRGEPLRFGFTSRPEVQRYKERLGKIVEATPAVQKALENRRVVVRELVAELVKADLLPDDALSRHETYFHQQVLAKMQAERVGGDRLARFKRGFQRKRVVGHDLNTPEFDYNTSFIEAEFEWMAEARQKLETRRFLERLDKQYGILGQLKRTAKATNYERVVGGPAIVEKINDLRRELENDPDKERKGEIREELAELDPLIPFRERIAWNASRIRRRFKDRLAAAFDPDNAEGPWWTLLRQLANEAVPEADEEQVIAARTIFKAIDERETFIREKLGDRYVTWEQLLREHKGYEIWQPEPGNIFFPVFTVPERIVAAAQEGILRELNIDEDLKKMLALGGPREQWVLPREIVGHLESMAAPKPTGPIADLAARIMRGWKVWTLLNPKRALGYMLRNLFGDLDPILAGAPGVAKHVPQALSELRDYHYSKRLSLSDPLRRARDLAVISSSITANDIPDVKETRFLRRLFAGDQQQRIAVVDQVKGYFENVRTANEFRENALRYAAFLYYKAELDAKRLGHYGGANRAVVDSLARQMGPDVAAAHLARNLLGDYGNVSTGGEWLRRYLLPFWSWNEINLRRYPRIVVNAWKSGDRKAAGAASAAYGAVAVARIGTLYAILATFNHLLWPDEEDELTDDERAAPHLILGRTSDGRIIVLRNVSALGDLLEWAGINTLVARFPAFRDGQLTWGDLLAEAAKSPVNKAYQGVRPDLKAMWEVPSGQTYFPDVTNPRSMNRGEAAANVVGLRDEYLWARGMILGDGSSARSGYVARMIGVSDPRQNALHEIFDARDRWLRKQGRETTGRFAESAIAGLRNAAIQDDYEAFKKAREKYRAAGRDTENFNLSLGALDPLSRIAEEDEPKFLAFLSADQRKKLDDTRAYAKELELKMFAWWHTAAAESGEEDAAEAKGTLAKQILSQAKTLARRIPLTKTERMRVAAEQEAAKSWLRERRIDPAEVVAAYRRLHGSQLKDRSAAADGEIRLRTQLRGLSRGQSKDGRTAAGAAR